MGYFEVYVKLVLDLQVAGTKGRFEGPEMSLYGLCMAHMSVRQQNQVHSWTWMLHQDRDKQQRHNMTPPRFGILVGALGTTILNR